jgi:hypothetical protein
VHVKLPTSANREFKFHKGGQLFIRSHNAFSSEGSQHQKHLGRSPSAQPFTTAALTRDFVGMKSIEDKIKGGFEEAKGKVKEKAGKATGIRTCAIAERWRKQMGRYSVKSET